jgi:hypothetical protein
MTNFSIGKKAFQNSGIVNLGDLEFVERSNKIHIEKLLNGLTCIIISNRSSVGITWNGANNINTIQNTKGSGDSGV